MPALRRLTGRLLAAAGLALLLLSWPQSLGGVVAYVRVDGHSMYPALHKGDLAVVRRQDSYRVGDVVAYRIPRGQFGSGALVIHRIVGGDGATGFVTRGDDRTRDDEWRPRTGDVVGRTRLVVPGMGDRFAALARPMHLGALVGLLTAAVMLVPPPRPSARPGARTPARHSPNVP